MGFPNNHSRAAAHFLSLFASSGKGFKVRWMPLLSVPFVDEVKLESFSTPGLKKYSSGHYRPVKIPWEYLLDQPENILHQSISSNVSLQMNQTFSNVFLAYSQSFLA